MIHYASMTQISATVCARAGTHLHEPPPEPPCPPKLPIDGRIAPTAPCRLNRAWQSWRRCARRVNFPPPCWRWRAAPLPKLSASGWNCWATPGGPRRARAVISRLAGAHAAQPEARLLLGVRAVGWACWRTGCWRASPGWGWVSCLPALAVAGYPSCAAGRVNLWG
jgi:hypothetical protein